MQTAEIPGVWHQVWTAPFRAIRAVYWMLDRDAKVRSRGLQTVGRVVGTRTEEHSDGEGGTGYTDYVRYRFEANRGTRTDEKRVNDFGGVKGGDAIRVYYLPDTAAFDSAIETAPSALSTWERERLEASRRRTDRAWAEIANRTRAR